MLKVTLVSMSEKISFPILVLSLWLMSLPVKAMAGEQRAGLSFERSVIALAHSGISEFRITKLTSALQNAKKACHECTFGESPACMSTSCCEMATSDPDVFEEYVCCAGVGLFVDRKCTFPNDPDNPCGQAGPNGCAVCWFAPYENYCIAYENPDDPSACAYDFK
jgi:hypothetical protein